MLTICFFDVIKYNSYFVIFISLAAAFILLISLVFLTKVENVVYAISFFILIFSYYSFTIAPYSANTEQGAFFVIGSLIFIAIALLISDNFPEKIRIKFTRFDKFLIIIIYTSLVFSNLVINQSEITEAQGILKMISVGGSFILFANYFPCFLYYRKDLLITFLKIIVYIGILSGIVGIFTIIYPELIPGNEYPGLSTSFYKHPNATSSIYNFTIPLTIWFLIFKKEELLTIEKLIFTLGIIISVVSLFFTFSRFGIAMVLLSAMILFFRYSKKLFFIVLIFIFISSSFIIANFFTTKGSITVLGRIGLVETAFEMYKDNTHLLFGYGGISTKLIYENVKYSLGVTDLNNSPHNIILYSILLYGLFFTVALFIFFLKYYFNSLYYFFRYKVSELAILSLSVCSGLLFKNMGEDLLFFQEFFMWYLFLIFFGFMIIELDKSKSNLEFT